MFILHTHMSLIGAPPRRYAPKLLEGAPIKASSPVPEKGAAMPSSDGQYYLHRYVPLDRMRNEENSIFGYRAKP